MPTYQTLIVGAHFRPPAKQLLSVLPPGQRLRLEEENDNPYDASAVKVMLDLTSPDGESLLSEAVLTALEPELPNVGLTLEMLMSGGPVQLGYLPKADGKPIAKARLNNPAYLDNVQVRELMPECQCKLGLTLEGGVDLTIETGE